MSSPSFQDTGRGNRFPEASPLKDAYSQESGLNPLADAATISLPKIPTPEVTRIEVSPPRSLDDGAEGRLKQAFVTINAKILAAQVAHLGMVGGLAYGGYQLMQEYLAVAPFMVWGLFLMSKAKHEQTKKVDEAIIEELRKPIADEEIKYYSRIDKLLEPLSEAFRMPPPLVLVLSDTPGPYAGISRIAGRSLVMVSDGLLNLIDDRELRAVLAHELAHVSPWQRLVSGLTRWPDPLIKTSIWLVSTISISRLIGGKDGGFVSGALAGIAGLIGTVAAHTPLRLCQRYISRQTEIKTDLQACRVSGDPESLVSALRKIDEHRNQSAKVNWDEKLGLNTHPSDEIRFKAIRDAFGLKDS